MNLIIVRQILYIYQKVLIPSDRVIKKQVHFNLFYFINYINLIVGYLFFC